MAREKRTPRPPRKKGPSPFDKIHETLKGIGEAQQTLLRLEKNRQARIQHINARAQKDAEPFLKRVEELFNDVYVHANKQRKFLTQGNKRKRINTPFGVFGWRFPPPSVLFKVDEDTAIANAKAAGLEEKLVQIVEKFKKKALLEEPALVYKLSSVAIEQIEFFYVQPTNLEEIRRITEPVKRLVV